MKKRMFLPVILLLTLAYGGISGCNKGEDIVTPTETEVVEIEVVEPTVEPDSPSPEEQLAGKYDLIEFDYDDNIIGRDNDWSDLNPPLTPPIATGTLVMFQGDSFLLKWRVKRKQDNALMTFSADKWEASTTNIVLDTEGALTPDSISYTWQGTARTTLVMKVKLPPDFPLADPLEQILVWKKKTE